MYVTNSSAFIDAYKKHPGIEMCKVLFSVLALRADIRATATSTLQAQDFTRRHPFATWLSAFMTAYAGSLLSSFLMGESVLKPLCNPMSLLYVTFAWYAVFYSPGDVVHKLCQVSLVQQILIVCSEMYRVGQIQSGVRYAMRSEMSKDVKLKQVLMVLVGTSKGCGGALAKAVIRLLRSGNLDASLKRTSELESPSLFTKASFIASVIFTMYWTGKIPPSFDYAILNSVITFFFIFQRVVMSAIPEAQHRSSWVEGVMCNIFFGQPVENITDRLDKTTEEEEDKEGDNVEDNKPENGSGDGPKRRMAKKDD